MHASCLKHLENAQSHLQYSMKCSRINDMPEARTAVRMAMTEFMLAMRSEDADDMLHIVFEQLTTAAALLDVVLYACEAVLPEKQN